MKTKLCYTCMWMLCRACLGTQLKISVQNSCALWDDLSLLMSYPAASERPATYFQSPGDTCCPTNWLPQWLQV